MSAEVFSFRELRARTPELSGPERLAAFCALPEVLRAQAWADLRWRFDHIASLDFRDWCGDGC